MLNFRVWLYLSKENQARMENIKNLIIDMLEPSPKRRSSLI